MQLIWRLRRRALIVFTVAEAKAMFGGNEGRQLIDYVSKNYGAREYLVDGIWMSSHSDRVQDSRALLEPRVIQACSDVASIWNLIKMQSTNGPVKPDKILEQLIDARIKGTQLTLFSPWGPRYKTTRTSILDSDPEVKTLTEVSDFLKRLNNSGFSVRYVLMPADLYATEVNSLAASSVMPYFSNVASAAREIQGGICELAVTPWSEIRSANLEKYESLRTSLDSDFSRSIRSGELRKALDVAKRYNPGDYEASARRYCIERVCEARIIEDVLSPIKLSLVRAEKDALDDPLKRIYIVSSQAPWMR